MKRRWLVVLAFWGCRAELGAPTETVFSRYVAFGNSITAGFQSSGINDSTQRQAYPALVAAALGDAYAAPLLARPGCPAPLVNVFTGELAGGAGPLTCSFLVAAPADDLTNVAVPGAAVVDLYQNGGSGSGANPLTAIMLGGRTQLQAARASRPTFVTVWIGHNEVLGAARAGEPSLATPPATFASRYAAAMDSIATLGVKAAMLIGVVDVTRIPFLSPGSAYAAASSAGVLPASFQVSANCTAGAAGGDALVPFSYGIGELFTRATSGSTVMLDCVAPAQVLTPAEAVQIRGYIASYNAAIAAAASAHGWMYYDPNPVFDSVRVAGEIPAFPRLPPSPDAVTEPFGAWLSRDGTHPGALAHRVIAAHILAALNARYGTSFALPR